MREAIDRDADPQKQPGFAVGKRVWLKDTWDAAVVAQRLGDNAKNMTVRATPRYGYVAVTLADGSEDKVLEVNLRLTPPPGHTAKRETTKGAKPKARKEAVAPEYGTELTIYDVVEP